jgi:hypothetical protein
VKRSAYIDAASTIGKIPSDVVDVMVVNYLWLSLGGRLQMLSQGKYNHRVDGSSFYMRTEGPSKKRLHELFKRFESGMMFDKDCLESLRRGEI